MPDFNPKEFFDEKAKRFKANPSLAACGFNDVSNQCMTRVQERALRSAIRKLGGRNAFSGKSILDLGCGSGRWSGLFSELGASYYGVDISDEMIAVSRSFHPSLRFAVMDGKQIPADSETCDAVFAIAVLHHNQRPEQEALLGEIARVTKPGGYLVLFEGIGSVPTERIFPRSFTDWTKSVTSAGYESILHRGYHYFPIGTLCNFIARRLFPAWVNHPRVSRIESASSPLFSRILPITMVPGGRGLMLFRRTE